MPSVLKRFQYAETLHFITFSCFHRLPLLEAPGARETVEAVLEQTRARHLARVYAYVELPVVREKGLRVLLKSNDWLGTERARTNAAGQICQTETSQPWGDNAQTSGSCAASPDFLTGKPRDAESNLDDFGARYLSSQWGRWMSADWTASPSAVPYATITNPQSLNLYAYVGNDPVDGMDPDGHWMFPIPGNTCYSTATACLEAMNGQNDQNAVQAYHDSIVPASAFDRTSTGTAQQQSGADAHETGHTGGQQGINNQLKYKTVSGGQGTNPWEIQWSLKHDAATGGWIVQHIVADVQGGGHYDYWEAWPVPANSHTPSVSGTDGNGVSYSDRFSGPTGTHTHASARFYEGLTLPSSFTVQPQGFPSGILRTTTTNPNLPTNNATAPNVRWWMAY